MVGITDVLWPASDGQIVPRVIPDAARRLCCQLRVAMDGEFIGTDMTKGRADLVEYDMAKTVPSFTYLPTLTEQVKHWINT